MSNYKQASVSASGPAAVAGACALVTGGARGIGAAIVRRLAACNYAVCFTYHNSASEAEVLVNEIGGGRAFGVHADARDPANITIAVQSCFDRFGRLDALVNNAGITEDRSITGMSVDDWRNVMSANLDGAFFAAKTIIPHFGRQRHGAIVNIASVAGLMGVPGQANYCASKSGLIGLTRALAVETASRGIRVNAVAPGYIATNMTSSLGERRLEAIADRIPMRRVGEAVEIANVVAFLVSDEASYITGQVITVDGGLIIS